MNEYEKAFGLLNEQQRAAVEQIEGPVLVIAGPGTGKTQLLSTRVGYILEHTDAMPQNILALTFTEAGVDAMRQRLTQFLGQDAYDVNISTYHAFGSDLIRRYPEYAGGFDFEPVDEVGADTILRGILEALPYSNLLRSADTYARDLRSFISDAKRALMTPDNLDEIVKNNQVFINEASVVVSEVLADMLRINKDSLGKFDTLQQRLSGVKCGLNPPVASLKSMAVEQLQQALEESGSGNTKAITRWKNAWLEKDAQGNFIFGGKQANRKIQAASQIYRKYQSQMLEQKLYDYDDMILRAIQALEGHPDFKYTLAEQYLYIMLDEFQDTNAAQFRIVELLTDNPVNENRPNVLAVGDDDQAIYAFQGAELTNMSRFAEIYKDVRVIPLRDNYRSHRQILNVAHQVSSQIEDRLHDKFAGITKILNSAADKLPKESTYEKHEFISDAAQYDWVSKETKKLVDAGISLNEIAILAPRHKYLVPLLPYMAAQNLPVRYEKRENVIDKPANRMLARMSQLVLALAGRDKAVIDACWPEVLSYDFWQLPTELIWQLSWQASQKDEDWTNTLLGHEQVSQIALFFLRLKDILGTTNLEQQLDILMGANKEDEEVYALPMRSPFFSYYFEDKEKGLPYLEMLSDLSVMRGRLRSWKRQERGLLGLADFLEFINAHEQSGINILNSSPHHEAEEAINVMTAYQSKGREFEAVFILAALDEVWGSSARTQSSAIALPANLKFVRYRGDSDDERLRLLYVAITRAKTKLYLTSYEKTLDGKLTRPLKYLTGHEDLLNQVSHKSDIPGLQTIESYWHHRHVAPFKPKLKALLGPQLGKYQMSPTHLNQFTDVIYGGPEAFFLNTILRFPRAQPPAAQFGTVIHDCLRWIHEINSNEKKIPKAVRVLAFFDERLAARRLPKTDFDLLQERGHRALSVYLDCKGSDFHSNDKFEQSFKNEGVFVGDAHLAGKIDRLRFDKKNKLITVYDFKTGPSYDKWSKTNPTLHKYRQQLMMYKVLIEKSHSYAGWKVDKAILQFVEPPVDEQTIYELEMEFSDQELSEMEQLISAVWQHIMNLDFPDTTDYAKSIAGIRLFESSLIRYD